MCIVIFYSLHCTKIHVSQDALHIVNLSVVAVFHVYIHVIAVYMCLFMCMYVSQYGVCALAVI